jgi:NTE family protein
VVIKNHDDCNAELPPWLTDAITRSQNQSELQLTINGLDSYSDKKNRKYAHFVDGGITDNLGLRAIYDVLELGGGARRTAEILNVKPVKRFVIISVDASTTPLNTIDQSSRHPSLFDAANAMSDVQLQRYNVSTIDVMKKSMARWAGQLSTPQQQVESYFIQLKFKDLNDKEVIRKLNEIPTSFNLTDEQVDLLIKTGSDLLFSNPEFRRLQADFLKDE